MLALDDERWSTLQHAYGSAADIPAALLALKSSPATEDPALWELFWSSLFHQGDIYPASFAAVPHVIDAIAKHPEIASWHCFALVACIEVARARRSYPVDDFLMADYSVSWRRIPPLIGGALIAPRGLVHTSSVLAALAAAQQQPILADLLLETNETDLPEMLAWWQTR